MDRPPPEHAFAIVDPDEPGQGVRLRARVRSHLGLVVGLSILGFIVLVALLAPLLAPHDPYAQDLANRRVPPVWHAWFYDHAKASWTNPLGTDHIGRDYLSRLIYGARISIMIGVIAMLISGAIGITLGVVAGYYGGRIDMVVNFLITTRLSLPLILVALAVVALYGGSITIIIVVLGLLIWDRFAVVMRSVTMQVRHLDYVTVARAIGCSTPYIIFREIMPNVMSSLIVVATIEMALAILLEATLSFLGLGVQPPEPSWGLMLSEAKGDIFFNSWMITIPGLALFFLIFSINLVGDGVRDVTAPENRN
jgi:peptide/nickel transport system permease protein